MELPTLNMTREEAQDEVRRYRRARDTIVLTREDQQMLRAYRAIFLGEPARDMAMWADPAKSFRWPVILLLAVLLVAGFAPSLFLAYLQPSIEALLPK